jgi:uncharacterized protein HemX
MPQRIPRYIGNHLAGAYIVIVFAMALAIGVLLFLYKQQADETQKVAEQTQVLAEQSLKLSMEIQQQRRETIYTTCRSQNERHLNLARFLRKQGIPPQARPDVYVFIDKLAPLQNCREVVQAATNSD